jgi:arylformamidase
MSIDWEAQFNPRCAVPNADEYSANSKIKSDQAHQRFSDIEQLRYGQEPLANLNLRRSSQANQPLFVYIHGGYWRARDKDDFGYLFNALEPSDANVVILNYDLCPKVTVSQISEQIQQALLWLNANASSLGFDRERIYVAGHSAGAHLLAMVLAQPPAQFSIPDGMIRKAYLLSGIYELSPVLKISVNDEIRLKPEDVYPLSPVNFPPSQKTPYEIIVGQAEPEGWVAQSVDFSSYLAQQGAQTALTILPNRNHYSILQDMETPEGVLAARFISDMKSQ